MTVALLLASVQFLSACTLASYARLLKTRTFQHQQASATDQHNDCDHQKAVSAPSADFAMAYLGVVAAPVLLPVLMATTPVLSASHRVLESPPGLVTPSVLRI